MANGRHMRVAVVVCAICSVIREYGIVSLTLRTKMTDRGLWPSSERYISFQYDTCRDTQVTI